MLQQAKGERKLNVATAKIVREDEFSKWLPWSLSGNFFIHNKIISHITQSDGGNSHVVLLFVRTSALLALRARNPFFTFV